jgi:hypothetical protein
LDPGHEFGVPAAGKLGEQTFLKEANGDTRQLAKS